MTELWNHDTPVMDFCTDLGGNIEIPKWIDQDITCTDVAAIIQGGCESGAYMPAVTYYQAVETMSKHGDDVLQYLEDINGELPTPPNDVSWSGLACHYLSTAVECWAYSVESELESAIAA